MDKRLLGLASGLLLTILMFSGTVQVLNAQQSKSDAPSLSVVTLDVTGMT